jgi:hypothetical protein
MCYIWPAEGDQIIFFFHAKAKKRARTNKIVLSRRENGTYTSSQGELEIMAASFHIIIFTTQGDIDPSMVTNYVLQKVT